MILALAAAGVLAVLFLQSSRSKPDYLECEIVIPDDYFGPITIDSQVGSAVVKNLAHGRKLQVVIDGAGRGHVEDCSYINKGFMLTAKRVSGRELPVVVVQTDDPWAAGERVEFSEAGGSGCISLMVLKPKMNP